MKQGVSHGGAAWIKPMMYRQHTSRSFILSLCLDFNVIYYQTLANKPGYHRVGGGANPAVLQHHRAHVKKTVPETSGTAFKILHLI